MLFSILFSPICPIYSLLYYHSNFIELSSRNMRLDFIILISKSSAKKLILRLQSTKFDSFREPQNNNPWQMNTRSLRVKEKRKMDLLWLKVQKVTEKSLKLGKIPPMGPVTICQLSIYYITLTT